MLPGLFVLAILEIRFFSFAQAGLDCDLPIIYFLLVLR
jgi:hypothetical protein